MAPQPTDVFAAALSYSCTSSSATYSDGCVATYSCIVGYSVTGSSQVSSAAKVGKGQAALCEANAWQGLRKRCSELWLCSSCVSLVAVGLHKRRLDSCHGAVVLRYVLRLEIRDFSTIFLWSISVEHNVLMSLVYVSLEYSTFVCVNNLRPCGPCLQPLRTRLNHSRMTA